MQDRIFFPQEVLDEWSSLDFIEVRENVLMHKKYDRKFSLRQAVYFMADVGDGSDPYNLVGRVKDEEQIKALGAEVYMGSAILGETAYQVVSGFVGTDLDIPAVVASVKKTDKASSDQGADEKDLLAKFLLENL